MIRLLVVGQAGIELDGKRLTAESEIVFGVLLFLAARAGDTIARDEAQALFWPELSHKRGRHCLRQALYRLRQLGVPLRPEQELVGVALGDITSDYAALTVDDVPASTYKGLAIADILPAYQPTFSTPFSAWVEEFRSRIGLRIRQGLVRTIIDLRSKGRYREAEPLARACLTADPLNEIATLTLAEATAVLSGNRAEAMAILDRYMDEIGGTSDKRMTLSASVLRRRISERFIEQRYAAPPDPPFVGREDVLELLVESMQRAVAGRSCLVYLWGEAGIGKTRLLGELAKVAHIHGVRVEKYSVSPNDVGRPLALFSAILPQMMQLQGAIGISPDAFEAIRRFVDPLAWEHVEPPRSASESAATFERLKAAICDLFQRLAEERSFAFFLDDAHWIDSRSVEVLAEVVERLRGSRVAFFLTSREHVKIAGRGGLDSLCARAAVRQLHGLDSGQVEVLVTRIAEQRNFDLTPEFIRRTVDTAAGNPLFVSELAAHYAWNGMRDDLPHNMQTLLEKRLDSLTGDALLVFQACALLANHATLERVRRMLEVSSHRLMRALHEIESVSILVNQGAVVACRHELLGKEALGRLTPIARKALYQRAAIVLESAGVQEMNAATCWHAVDAWLEAEEPDRALRSVTEMAGRLLSAGLPRDVDALLTKARGVLQDASRTAVILPLQWRAARAMGDLGRALEIAHERVLLNQRPDQDTREARFAELAAFDVHRDFDFTDVESQFDTSLFDVPGYSPDDVSELALRIVMSADDFLDPATARRCFEALDARRTLQMAAKPVKGIFEIVYHSHFGDLDIAVARARQFIVRAQTNAHDDQSTRARRLRWAHRPLLLAGFVEEALDALGMSIVAAKRCGSTRDEVCSTVHLIDALFTANRIDATRASNELPSDDISVVGSLVQSAVSFVRASLLFATGRLNELRIAVGTIDSRSDITRPNRRSVALDSFRILESLLEGCEPDERRIQRLMMMWPQARGLSYCDIHFIALVAALLLTNRSEAAERVCLEYKCTRRERLPLPNAYSAQLRSILLKAGVTPSIEFRHFL